MACRFYVIFAIQHITTGAHAQAHSSPFYRVCKWLVKLQQQTNKQGFPVIYSHSHIFTHLVSWPGRPGSLPVIYSRKCANEKCYAGQKHMDDYWMMGLGGLMAALSVFTPFYTHFRTWNVNNIWNWHKQTDRLTNKQTYIFSSLYRGQYKQTRNACQPTI